MIYFISLLLFFFIDVSNTFAASGCCSHHNGISYCGGNGMYVCNDGQESPTCECGYTKPVYVPIKNSQESLNENTELDSNNFINRDFSLRPTLEPTLTPLPTKTFVEFVTDASPGGIIFYTGLGFILGLFICSLIGFKT